MVKRCINKYYISFRSCWELNNMIIIHLSLLYQLVCFSQAIDHSSEPLHHLKLAIIENDNFIADIYLRSKQRVLANEHLPVWILNGIIDENSIDNIDGNELHRDYEVMKQLGGFTVYQQPETSSSTIYFHKYQEFAGMIDHEFVIHKLSIAKLHSTGGTILELDRFGVYRRPEYKTHKYDRKVVEADPDSGVTHQGSAHTYKARLYDSYPEVLVIVSWDLAEKLTRGVPKSDWYPGIVSYVLTLFNGVDMLYSKLEFTNIQINIAGVVIGTAMESFRFLKNCYHTEPMGSTNFRYRLEGVCVTEVFRRFLSARRDTIPLDSYDMAIFLTRETLYNMMEDVSDSHYRKFQRIIGIVGSTNKLYETRAQDKGFILVGTITTNEYFENYPTLAHEMAHLMTVKHDKPEYFTENGECCGHLMKTSGQWCDKCLSWSKTSEKSFYLFFTSSNCCAFINPPRSLSPPGRYRILSDDIQCQCYGYESAKKFWDLQDFFWGFCKVKLRCGTDNEFWPTVIPMDGTPCDNEKVCWRRKCEPIEIFTQSHKQNNENSWLSAVSV